MSARLDRCALHGRLPPAPPRRRRDVDRLGPAGEGEAHAAVLLHLTGAGDGGILIALQVREADHRGGEKRAAIAQAPHQLHVLLRVLAPRSARLDRGPLHLRLLAVPVLRRGHKHRRGAAPKDDEAQAAVVVLLLGALDGGLLVACQLL